MAVAARLLLLEVGAKYGYKSTDRCTSARRVLGELTVPDAWPRGHEITYTVPRGCGGESARSWTRDGVFYTVRARGFYGEVTVYRDGRWTTRWLISPFAGFLYVKR